MLTEAGVVVAAAAMVVAILSTKDVVFTVVVEVAEVRFSLDGFTNVFSGAVDDVPTGIIVGLLVVTVAMIVFMLVVIVSATACVVGVEDGDWVLLVTTVVNGLIFVGCGL